MYRVWFYNIGLRLLSVYCVLGMVLKYFVDIFLFNFENSLLRKVNYFFFVYIEIKV